MNLSRRSLIGAGLVLAAAGLAGCGKAVQTALTTSSAAPDHPTPTATGSATIGPPSPTSPSALSADPPSTTAGSPAEVSSPGPPSGPAAEITNGPRDKPSVALTFHGAGDVDLARQILAIANTPGARITVMVVGMWLSDIPGIAAEILAGGHQLGNHTWSHQDINALPESEMRQEVIRCRDLLVRTAGTPGTCFRPSQTPTANALMKQIAGEAGY